MSDEAFKRMKEWFGRALGAADFDLRLQDKEKGESWKESSALFLFNKMMGHVNKMMDPNSKVGQVHAVKVANYALMITTRLAGDNVAVEAEPEKDTIAALEELAGTITEEEAKEAFPRHAKSSPKGESEDEGYYCPWCNHTAKLGVGCRGNICCILCGKPIDSRFAVLLKKARQFDHVIMKKPITSATMAKYLGTSSNWAGQVLAQLGWKSAGWRKGLGARWNPPKEDKE